MTLIKKNNRKFRFRSFGGKVPDGEALRLELEEVVSYFEERENQLVDSANTVIAERDATIEALTARVAALENAP